jgi:CRISPR/Cas system-associated endonuclease/helicase Cas3
MAINLQTEQFRRLWMPYLVYKINDDIGGWIPLNRHYKPIGTPGTAWVKYEETPKHLRIKTITLSQQKKLFHWVTEDASWLPNDMVWLYSDSCIPTSSAANWNQYQQKLQLLAKLNCFGLDNQ